MHVHIVLAHPEPNSFNGALTKMAEASLTRLSHTVTLRDLYQADFDPVERGDHYEQRSNPEIFAPLAEQRHAAKADALPADVRREIRDLERADLVILQFPLWWHAPPAILKGWFDRVFVNGGVYTSRMRYDTGFFRGRKAMVSVTTGAPKEAFGPAARGGDFETMLWPTHYSLHYLGFSVLPPFMSYGVQGHGYAYREPESLERHLNQTLSDRQMRLSEIASQPTLSFPGWNDWDASGRAVRQADAAPGFRCSG